MRNGPSGPKPKLTPDFKAKYAGSVLDVFTAIRKKEPDLLEVERIFLDQINSTNCEFFLDSLMEAMACDCVSDEDRFLIYLVFFDLLKKNSDAVKFFLYALENYDIDKDIDYNDASHQKLVSEICEEYSFGHDMEHEVFLKKFLNLMRLENVHQYKISFTIISAVKILMYHKRYPNFCWDGFEALDEAMEMLKEKRNRSLRANPQEG